MIDGVGVPQAWDGAARWYRRASRERPPRETADIVVAAALELLRAVASPEALRHHYRERDGDWIHGVAAQCRLPNDLRLDLRRIEDAAYGLRWLELTHGLYFDPLQALTTQLAVCLLGERRGRGLSGDINRQDSLLDDTAEQVVPTNYRRWLARTSLFVEAALPVEEQRMAGSPRSINQEAPHLERSPADGSGSSRTSSTADAPELARAILHAAGEGIISLDAEGRIAYAKPGGQRRHRLPAGGAGRQRVSRPPAAPAAHRIGRAGDGPPAAGSLP